MDVSTADKLDSAFKEATKARSEALVLTLQGVCECQSKTNRGLGAKKLVAGDLPLGRFCG